MKNIILVIVIVISLIFNLTTSMALPVGSAFSYQGELKENGSPANGLYDIQIQPFDKVTGNNSLGGSKSFLATTVVNGTFTIPEVDFGDAIYGGDDIWLEILVKPTGDPTYTQLTPRQRLNAVPYAVQAEFLAANGANNGDVLQFDGSDWVAAASSGLSPWTDSGTTLTSFGNKVGIGANPSDKLHIQGAAGEDLLRVQSSNNTKFRIFENGSVVVGSNYLNGPANGLYVKGDTKQFNTSRGMMKYMVRINCNNDAPFIVREYNATTVAGGASIIHITTGLCEITFPFDVTNNFISATAIYANFSVLGSNNSRNVSCSDIQNNINLNTKITCSINDGDGGRIDGIVDVIVY